VGEKQATDAKDSHRDVAYHIKGDTFDELRALVACIYGAPGANAASEDLAKRAGHYAKAKLSASDVFSFSEKDLDLFSLAVLFNSEAILDRKLRPVIEDAAFGGGVP
jgi:hypothetical protein